MVSPRTFLILWLLLAVLVAAVVAGWFVRTPVYAAGPATVVTQQAGDGGGDVSVVAFLPAAQLAHLKAGQTIFLVLDGGAAMRRAVQTVEPTVLSPTEARTRFGLDAQAASALTGPVAVALVDAASFPSDLPASAYAGSVFRARVELGTRRLISLVPLGGGLLGG
jgi:hypothetical protein